MLLYHVYKAIKQRLGTTVPVFFFIGQYLKGKGNTSYRVPAVYIELPKNVNFVFYGRRLLTAKNVLIKIHYISYAPFKNMDNPVQDSAIAAHETKVNELNALLDGWHAVEMVGNTQKPNGLPITNQLLPTGGALLNFMEENLVSVVTYTTEVYKR